MITADLEMMKPDQFYSCKSYWWRLLRAEKKLVLLIHKLSGDVPFGLQITFPRKERDELFCLV